MYLCYVAAESDSSYSIDEKKLDVSMYVLYIL